MYDKRTQPVRWYLWNLACALDQLINALCNGWADESMSSHAYRLHRDGKRLGWLMRVYDALFFWQRLPEGVTGHCHWAWLRERARYQLPPEMRP